MPVQKIESAGESIILTMFKPSSRQRLAAEVPAAFLAACAGAASLDIINQQLGYFTFSDVSTIPQARLLKRLDYDEVGAP